MRYKCACCDNVFDEDELCEVDVGIGGYEYWGAKGTHVDVRTVSPCCESEDFTEEDENEK
jgi:hypothetical protein